MGQYFIICNLDKQEVINPSAFGDGAKLGELSGNGGTLDAIAMLTCSGNRGDDGYELPYNAALDSPPPGVENHFENDQLVYANGWKPRNRMPAPLFDVVGSWAGDRIVTAGDYGPMGKFLTPSQIKTGRGIWEEERKARKLETGTVYPPLGRSWKINLYQYAVRCFTNISDTVVAVFRLCEFDTYVYNDQRWLDEVFEIQKRCLHYAYNDGRKLPKRRNTKQYKADLTWMSIEAVEMMVRRLDDPLAIRSVKAWLRRQTLTPLIRDCLACYAEDGNVDFDLRATIQGKHGIDTHGPGNLRGTPILPPPDLIDAALEVARIRDEADKPKTVVHRRKVNHRLVAAVAEQAGVPYRTRTIQLK